MIRVTWELGRAAAVLVTLAEVAHAVLPLGRPAAYAGSLVLLVLLVLVIPGWLGQRRRSPAERAAHTARRSVERDAAQRAYLAGRGVEVLDGETPQQAARRDIAGRR